jgi:hypothetical protein
MSNTRIRTFSIAAFSMVALALVVGSGPSFRPTTTLKGSSLAGWHSLGDATWTAVNGEITGTPKEPNGGWLVLDQSFQDVGFSLRTQVLGRMRDRRAHPGGEDTGWRHERRVADVGRDAARAPSR